MATTLLLKVGLLIQWHGQRQVWQVQAPYIERILIHKAQTHRYESAPSKFQIKAFSVFKTLRFK